MKIDEFFFWIFGKFFEKIFKIFLFFMITIEIMMGKISVKSNFYDKIITNFCF